MYTGHLININLLTSRHSYIESVLNAELLEFLMKILALDTKSDYAKLKIDNADDIWILSKILDKGDIVGAETTRIVKKEEGQEGLRKKMFVKVKAEKIEFSASSLRILGTIIESSNPDVPHGSFHTITAEPKDVLQLSKKFQRWQVERLKDAEEASGRPKVILCSADYGEVKLALLKEFGIEPITELNKALPGKKKETEKIYEKSRNEFLKELAGLLEEMAKTYKVNKIVFGGIGFLNENFQKILEDKPNLKNMIHMVKIYSSGESGINEIIKLGAVDAVVKNSRISEETKIVEKFFEQVSTNGLATYGMVQVKQAVDYGAVEILLVSDELISKLKESGSFEELDALMIAAEKAGTRVMIVSTEHDAGERFSKMEIGAILRYRI